VEFREGTTGDVAMAQFAVADGNTARAVTGVSPTTLGGDRKVTLTLGAGLATTGSLPVVTYTAPSSGGLSVSTAALPAGTWVDVAADGVAPVFTAGTASATALTIAFDEPVSGTTVASEWSVTGVTDAMGSAVATTATPATATLAGAESLTLTLSPALVYTDVTPSVSYTAPTGDGATPLEDGSGNGLGATPVTATDGLAPVIDGATYMGSTRDIVVTFTENLDAATVTAANIMVFGLDASGTRTQAALTLDSTYNVDGIAYTAGVPADPTNAMTRTSATVTVRLAAADAHPAYKLVITASVTDAATPPNAYVPIADATPDDGTDDADRTVTKPTAPATGPTFEAFRYSNGNGAVIVFSEPVLGAVDASEWSVAGAQPARLHRELATSTESIPSILGSRVIALELAASNAGTVTAGSTVTFTPPSPATLTAVGAGRVTVADASTEVILDTFVNFAPPTGEMHTYTGFLNGALSWEGGASPDPSGLLGPADHDRASALPSISSPLSQAARLMVVDWAESDLPSSVPGLAVEYDLGALASAFHSSVAAADRHFDVYLLVHSTDARGDPGNANLQGTAHRLGDDVLRGRHVLSDSLRASVTSGDSALLVFPNTPQSALNPGLQGGFGPLALVADLVPFDPADPPEVVGATVTVMVDTAPPTITAARSTSATTTVVTFSEPVSWHGGAADDNVHPANSGIPVTLDRSAAQWTVAGEAATAVSATPPTRAAEITLEHPPAATQTPAVAYTVPGSGNLLRDDLANNLAAYSETASDGTPPGFSARWGGNSAPSPNVIVTFSEDVSLASGKTLPVAGDWSAMGTGTSGNPLTLAALTVTYDLDAGTATVTLPSGRSGAALFDVSEGVTLRLDVDGDVTVEGTPVTEAARLASIVDSA
ncbi:MAG: hypothetical protein OXU53_11435, partial [Deltaproteobacteria bacterium]|nr:hypothetical protein [Deltaproteobacteria bacterium]